MALRIPPRHRQSRTLPAQLEEQAVTPQREIAPQQEQRFDLGLGL
jgi:hypothetical protein